MKNCQCRACAVFTAVLFLAACLASICSAAPDTQVKLKVAFPETTGISEVYEDGSFGGCVYDWLHEIAKYTGWEYEFVTGDTSELLDGMIAGEYDLMGGMFYNDGYEELFCYPQYIMGANDSLLIYAQGDNTIKSFDYNTLRGKRIGVLKRAAKKIERLQKFLSYNNLQCELVYYDDLAAYENCLDSGEVDLLYGNDVYMKDSYNVAAKIEADPFYLVSSIQRPELCAQLSEAMGAIYDANPNFAEELYQKYFPEEYINSIVLTEEEQEFITSAGPIRVAMVRDQFPLLYEENGAVMGIVPSCLELISGRTGLSFTYIWAENYKQLIALAKDGRADIIGCFLNQDPSADALGLARTASFASLKAAILRNKRMNPSAGSLRFAIPQGSDLQPINPGDIVNYYDSYADCLDAVNRGEAGYTQMPAAFVEDFYLKDFYANVTLTADIDLVQELTLALPKPVDVQLYSILNKAINNLSDKELDAIVSQNLLASRTSQATLENLLYTNPVLVFFVCVGIAMLVCTVVLVFNRYKLKNNVMRLKLEKAVETSRARSEFLSRISHEIRTPMNAIIGLTNLSLIAEELSPAVEVNLRKIDSAAQFLLALVNDVLDMSKIENQKMELKSAPFDLSSMLEKLEDMFALQADAKHLELIFRYQLTDQFYCGDEMRISQVLTNLLSNACKFTEEGGRVQLCVLEASKGPDSACLQFSVEDTGIGIHADDLERIFHSFEQAAISAGAASGTGLGLAISRSLVELMGGELKVKSAPGEGSRFSFSIELPLYHGVLDSAAKPSKQAFSSLAGLHVLLAEDNDINAEIAIELLALQQVSVERAKNGRQAVELFAGRPEGYYDLILMDLNMPVMDGLAATREIRSMSRADAGVVPILAMTANTFQEDREKAAAAGMTGFLPKPFDVEQLYSALCSSV